MISVAKHTTPVTFHAGVFIFNAHGYSTRNGNWVDRGSIIIAITALFVRLQSVPEFFFG